MKPAQPLSPLPLALTPLTLLLLLPILVLAARGAGHLRAALAVWDVALESLLLSIGGTLLALGLALLLAFLALLGGVGRGLEALLMLSFYIPPFVTGMGLLFTFQSLGKPIYGVPGILLAWTVHYTPLAYALLRPSLESVLPLLRAARAHGVVGIRRLRVLLPPLLPSLLSAGGVLYLALLGNFGVPAVLGLPARVYTLPTLAYGRLNSPLSQDPLGEAAALGLALGILALPALLLRPRPLLEAVPREGLTSRPLFRLTFALYALLALLLSTWGLLREALLNPYTGGFEPAFGAALDLPLVQKGLGNSLLLAVGTAVGVTLLAMVLRPFPRALRQLRVALDLHHTLPGSLLGLADPPPGPHPPLRHRLAAPPGLSPSLRQPRPALFGGRDSGGSQGGGGSSAWPVLGAGLVPGGLSAPPAPSSSRLLLGLSLGAFGDHPLRVALRPRSRDRGRGGPGSSERGAVPGGRGGGPPPRPPFHPGPFGPRR